MTTYVVFCRHISGIGEKMAKKLVESRLSSGPFVCRSQLLSIAGLGPKTFEQCAGFLRVMPQNSSGSADWFVSLSFLTCCCLSSSHHHHHHHHAVVEQWSHRRVCLFIFLVIFAYSHHLHHHHHHHHPPLLTLDPRYYTLQYNADSVIMRLRSWILIFQRLTRAG